MAPSIDYIPQNNQVYNSFKDEITKSFAKDLVIVLKKVKVLIYSGQNDYIVNSAGTQNFINSLNWDGISNWKKSKKSVWSIRNEIRGWAKVYSSLWYAIVNGAGHKISADQP